MENEIMEILDILDNVGEQNFSNFDMDLAHKQDEALSAIYRICDKWHDKRTICEQCGWHRSKCKCERPPKGAE